MPIVLRLKLFECRRFESDEARARALDELDEVLSRRFASFIGRMRGAFIKAAQVLGSLSPPPVRPKYVRKLEPMVDAAPGGRPWRHVRRQLNRELRRSGHTGGVEEVFSSFDREPLGTASVGQVHRAVLRDSGRVVAVKLQYPDAKRLILSDLGNIHGVLTVLGKKAEANVVKEYRSRMGQEFDYEEEGRTMNAVSSFFGRGGSSGGGGGGGGRSTGARRLASRLVVPRCYEGLSTRKLLVMDFVEGRSMREALLARVAALDRYPPPIRLPLLLSLRASTERQLALLLRAQALQIFELGTFNADPHPGNVFLVPRARRGLGLGGLCGGGGGARLGLLDFGCSKTLSARQRASLARLYMGLSARDDDAVVSAAVEMGMRTKHMDRSVIVQFATHFFDRNVADCSPPAFLLQLNQQDKITALPKEYMLVARSSLLLRGLGAKLQAPQHVSAVWAKEARRYLREYERTRSVRT
ncbi:ABC1 family protein [Emiliania huxleyi CCMP1516]|uniref:ABC1 atypical kinase-like domain-containing protein n=2 Tax=Emiliania huxleyi TaxID=2903 RepID=A0A0D3KDL6_EMIH1|nr:ABC1 family protein [Emiliania huxleyi CCMP1516]EOD33851.1 ABC1 family protein [Emiliania huxleyi CCMP1516]|eukprot:XP_005786280.1 ABC1 family protein [Emiliania huxleyi CCMP1516]